MVFLWFPYGFPMVFLWFSYGFHRERAASHLFFFVAAGDPGVRAVIHEAPS